MPRFDPDVNPLLAAVICRAYSTQHIAREVVIGAVRVGA